jgi:hypothetical protein
MRDAACVTRIIANNILRPGSEELFSGDGDRDGHARTFATLGLKECPKIIAEASDSTELKDRSSYSKLLREARRIVVRIMLIKLEPNMTELQAAKTGPSSSATAVGRLFVLELSGDRIHSMNLDGSDRKTIVTDCHLPDGVVVDAKAGHIYWTNMGVPNLDDGSIERADLDGGNRRVIVPQGVTHTPKQIHLDKDNGKLYWCDREGMRVMRANLDGSQVETLVETGRGDKDRHDQTRWCVGITIDPKLGKIYWTQKGPTKGGLGRLCRANIDLPKGASPANRSDIEVLFDRLPEPIDLEFDLTSRVLYWTDRGDPPRGNTVNRAPIDTKAEPEIVITHLMEGIGIALDIPGNQMFVTDFAGSIYSADLDGKNERNFLYAQGNLTGIAYADV